MSNTRLRAADLADEFRSISSDKRMEYVPAQAVHLLIAADMLDEVERLQAARDLYLEMVGFVKDENAKLRDELDLCLKCEECEAMLDCDECLRADASQKERKRVDYENAKLRELVRDMAAEIRGLGIDFARVGWCDYADRMREFGVEV